MSKTSQKQAKDEQTKNRKQNFKVLYRKNKELYNPKYKNYLEEIEA